MSARRKEAPLVEEPPVYAPEPYRYRLMMFQRPVAPWREARAAAEQDALDMKMGSRDDHSGIVYLTVPANIAMAPR